MDFTLMVTKRALCLLMTAILSAIFPGVTKSDPLSQNQIPLEFLDSSDHRALDISADGNIVVGKVRLDSDHRFHPYVHNLTSGEETILDYPGQADEDTGSTLSSLAVSGDGNLIALSTCDDGSYKCKNYIYNRQQRKSTPVLEEFNELEWVDFQMTGISPDGSRLLVSVIQHFIGSEKISKTFAFYDIATEKMSFLDGPVMADMPLPNLPDDMPTPNINAVGISGDNKIAVGNYYEVSKNENFVPHFPNIRNIKNYEYSSVFLFYPDDLGSIISSDIAHRARATAISSDGSTVVGAILASEPENTDAYRAFTYDVSDKTIDDLGELPSGGDSFATAVNQDGSVIVGYTVSAVNGGTEHAFYHDKNFGGMLDLGTVDRAVNRDNVAYIATGVSADGSVVIGSKMEKQDNAEWKEKSLVWKVKRAELGSIEEPSPSVPAYPPATGDNLPADDPVVVGDPSITPASPVSETPPVAPAAPANDDNLPDNGEETQIAADTPATGDNLPADDPAVVGDPSITPASPVSETPPVAPAAPANDGNLPDNGEETQIAADTPATGDNLPADDPAVVGDPSITPASPVSETPPVAPAAPANDDNLPDIVMVEVENSQKTFVKMAEKDNELHDLYRSNLQSLGSDHCALEDKAYCIGTFANANRVYHSGHEVNTGIHGAARLAPQWRAGVSVAYLADDNLPGGIESRDSHTPGVGVYLRYAQNPDASGLSLTASGAYQAQELAIRRTTIGQTEPGNGDSKIAGTRFAIEGSYGVALDEHTLLSSSLGVQQLQTRREGYREERDAEFPATYGKSGEKSTALQIGLGVDHDLTETLSLHADAGTRVVLDRDRDAFTVQAKYLGGFVDHLDEQVDVMPYANASISARWGTDRASLARLRVGIAKSDYGNNDANIGFSYDYRF